MTDHRHPRQTLGLEPGRAAALLGVARHHEASYGWREAAGWARRAMAAASNDPGALALLVRSLALSGEFEAAARAAPPSAGSGSPELARHQAFVLSMLGRRRELDEHLAAMARNSDATADDLLYLARLAFAAHGDWQRRSATYLRRAIATAPALIGPLGWLIAVETGRSFDDADDFVSNRDVGSLQEDTVPFVATFHSARVLPDGTVLTADGKAIVVDILTAPGMHFVNAPRFICTDAMREAIVATNAPCTRALLNCPRAERHVVGSAMLFGGNENFGHIVNDYLSKMATLPRIDPSTPVVLANRCHGAAAAFLEKLGVGSDRLIRQASNEILRVDRLIVPSMTHRFPELPGAHVRWLRERFRRPRDPGAEPGRILISRRGTFGRQIANSSEIASLLAEFGIEEVDFVGTPLDRQLALLGNCELIVGATGAGVVSFFFTQDDCAVIELRYPNMTVWADQVSRVSTELGQPYQIVPCERAPIPDAVSGDGNLLVPMTDLRRAIETALSGRSRTAASALRVKGLGRP